MKNDVTALTQQISTDDRTLFLGRTELADKFYLPKNVALSIRIRLQSVLESGMNDRSVFMLSRTDRRENGRRRVIGEKKDSAVEFADVVLESARCFLDVDYAEYWNYSQILLAPMLGVFIHLSRTCDDPVMMAK